MSYELKGVIIWLMHLLTWPLSIPSLIGYKLFSSEELFSFSAKILSLIPGKLGQYLRTSFYCQTLVDCKYDLVIGFCSFFAHPTSEVGRHVVIGSFTIIGTAKIGDNISVGSRVSIISGKLQHKVDEVTGVISEGQYTKVNIGNSCWLGEGSIVMADIGEHSVVSAGSIVTKNMPDRRTAIGNPARFLKLENIVGETNKHGE